MAQLADLEGKKRVSSSKLEQTIMTNRGMNIHLKRRLNVIEYERKRMLKLVARREKELQADLKTKKDEKFNLMLKYQMQKTANGGRGRDQAQLDDELANGIEGQLFTNGLVNAPGLNPRMKRLSRRMRILPDFEDDREEEITDQGDKMEQDASTSCKLEGRTFPTFPSTPANSLRDHGRDNDGIQVRNPQHHYFEDEKPEAVVPLTSGIISLINQNAEVKQLNSDAEHGSNGSFPVEIYGSGATTGKRAIHSSRGTSRRKAATSIGRPKTVHFSQSADGLFEDLFPAVEEDATSPSRRRGRNGHSRLSVVKSKIESNEKEFLLKLRIRSQELENEDVAKKVWEFIGKRPTSMHVVQRISRKSDDGAGDEDTLSRLEEETNASKFKAAASLTSQNI